MTNFSINFSNPWLLLLIIPAVLLTLIPYFRLNKRYRGTRNRIVSIVLHLIIMVLSISVLAGITFEYDNPNTENEVIILVDSSFSNDKSAQEKDDFIKSVIDNSNSMFKLGIVKFGFDQVYAVELTNNTSSVYAKYMQSRNPDVTATDIEAALTYTAGLFDSPETARIVLITDATETDGEAESVIKSIAAKGIKVDTVYFPNEEAEDEVRLVEMSQPEEKIKVGELFNVGLTLQSTYSGYATVTPYDNDIAGESIVVPISEGLQTIQIPYTFTLPGIHKMSFEMTSEDDTLKQNNIYTSYIYLEIFDKILVIESNNDESEALCRMLRDELKVTVINVADEDSMPKTLNDLRAYDQVVLCNIANSDMPEGFDEILYSYVRDIGGGVFTICGNEQDADPNDEEWTANAYTRKDMYGTLYQEMLPVEILNYTPPVAVMIVIDSSGSMYNPSDGEEAFDGSKLYYAMQGAETLVNGDILSERDYIGIMTLSDSYQEHIELTPRTQRDKILAAIEGIRDSQGGGTVFSTTLERAGKALSALSGVEKRHIIIITDGEPSKELDEEDLYKKYFQQNAKLGITTSIIGVQCTTSAQKEMQMLLEDYAGMKKDNFYAVDDLERIASQVREDIMAPEIKDVNYTNFVPTIATNSSITKGIEQANMPSLDGFYGVKAKEGATVILAGQYTPIYTQWQFGKGMVGTFACDLNGTWSSNFIDTAEATTIINNIITALFPTENIQPKNIELEVSGDNYKSQLSVYTELLEGEHIEIKVTSPIAEGQTDPLVQIFKANTAQGFSRIEFAVTTPGIHEIVATKYDAEGNVIAQTTEYKALAYSQEYNPFVDPDVAEDLAKSLATRGNGMMIDNPWQVFENAVKYLHKVIDPRTLFMIIVLVLFLLDVAVRKFKWKWPHEIIRDKKAKKSNANV